MGESDRIDSEASSSGLITLVAIVGLAASNNKEEPAFIQTGQHFIFLNELPVVKLSRSGLLGSSVALYKSSMWSTTKAAFSWPLYRAVNNDALWRLRSVINSSLTINRTLWCLNWWELSVTNSHRLFYCSKFHVNGRTVSLKVRSSIVGIWMVEV